MKLFALLATMLLESSILAADWPQWLGPERNGISPETGLLTSWPEKGPKVIWQREVGAGYSGPVVKGDRLILFHRLEDQEVVECLHAGSGKKLWQFAYPTAYEDSFGKGNGPRSTPLIHGKKVITLGAEGWLHCLDLESGQKIWARPLHQDYQIPPSFFGISTSPVVEQNLVLLNVGAKKAGIVALALENGKEVWRATHDPASYSSPVIASVNGDRQGIFFTRTGIVILNPKTGQVIFQRRMRANIDASVNAATPVVVGDLAFFSASYDTGALLLKLGKKGAEEVWQGEDIMSNHYNTCIYHQGYLYGFDGRTESVPGIRCIEMKTGKIQWTSERFGCGSLILAQGNLIVLTERGDLVLVEATPLAYREKARANVLDTGPCRAQTALAEGRLYARDEIKLICLDLRK